MKVCDFFDGTKTEKEKLVEIIEEWNSRVSLTEISNRWKKCRPAVTSENLSLILYNCQCLSTHIADLDVLISTYTPQICILTGVGAKIRDLPVIASYYWISQEGSNAFGGVAMLIHNTLKMKTIARQKNFVITELDIQPKPILLGAIYIPPGQSFPHTIFEKYLNKPFFIFGDYNAKHTDWLCSQTNTSGCQLKSWLEETGCEMIYPNRATSKRSTAIIDFGITHNADGWKADVLNEGSSDHYPVLIKVPLPVGEGGFFRKTNWKVFTYFLNCVFPYFNSLVYNLNGNSFFEIFSSFLTSIWDKVSDYIHIKRYRPPWPPHLVKLARNQNSARRRYRRSKTRGNLEYYLMLKNTFAQEKSNYLKEKIDKRISFISQGSNIWKYVHNTFHPYAPAFKGITTDGKTITNHQEMADNLADYYEKHFKEPDTIAGNGIHDDALEEYENILEQPKIPLDAITFDEVEKNWRKAQKKKSTDNEGLSAFVLHQLPREYLQIITIAYNKLALNGDVLDISRHAKVICLSKDGLYPEVNKLRPISLLSNFGKCFERIIHARILKWCKDKGIYTDEQSGFTAERRLQTRILSLVEDLRITTAANNRPAVVVFVDFMSAFDKMWHPGLVSTLLKLDFPLPLLRWI